ncbi:P-loop containing nucleoside triphosphate hydrolase protein [Rhodofomes roseus]|uniref:P-loop containing nucleoside triphosphate hydrolase protein n=1 Tax=Rhodofomes roseus TaxID=34475 RepID=A0ABQ8K342_9APHY|nr:P-loop containing nucleoside triphosphate hydrolase protein [Rhodofomes roseus]KAH9831231.1 P-loop containing nucleoside triphosphate hydrolase protein [Rhodofomes roseus]
MPATLRSTRSTVLGKRTHQESSSDSNIGTGSVCDEGFSFPTPDPSPDPKRPRTTTSFVDGDGNKENIPPVVFTVLNRTPSSRRVRRSSTEGSVSPRRTPRRTASSNDLTASPRTPSTSFNHLSLSTPPPSPPSALLPLHVRVRALLRATSNGVAGMTGRTAERALIQHFLTAFFTAVEEHTALYISGSPGTGKTALVNDVLRACRTEMETSDVKAIVLNCMTLKGVDAIWEGLAEALDEGSNARRLRKAKESPAQRVQRLLSTGKFKSVVVLDELDHAVSDDQSLLSLFTFAETLSEHLRVIGIANTHTLTSSTTTASLQSVKSVKTTHFTAYAPQHLLEILTSRLAPLYDDVDCAEHIKQFLPATSLTLLTKKIASQTGDVRAVFEVLRRAIDLALVDVKSDDPLSAPNPVVTPANVLAALKAQPSANVASTPSVSGASAGGSELVAKVRGLGLHQRLVVLATLLARKRVEASLPLSGTIVAASPTKTPRSPVKRAQSSSAAASAANGPLDVAQLHAFYSAILSRGDSAIFKPVSRSEFTDLLGLLETVGLATLSSGRGNMPGTPSKTGRKGFSRSASFTTGSNKGVTQEVCFAADIRLDEVSRGLGIALAGAEAEPPSDAREEEVRTIWERELVRIAREVKASARGSAVTDVFEGALEA